MGNEFVVQIDDSDVKRKLKQLKGVRDGAPRAMMRAFNRTVTGMKTDATKEIVARYTVTPQREVRDKLDTYKASLNDLSAALHSKGRPIRSIKFKHRSNRNPGRRGASPAFLKPVKNKQGGKLTGSSLRSKGFMATMPNGTQGIFQRTGKETDPNKIKTGKSASRYLRRRERENIEQVHAPGVAQMLSNPNVSKAITEKASARFYKELDHEIDYLLKQ